MYFFYKNLFLIICFCLLICLVLIILPFILRVILWDEEKVSLYECGFNPFFESPVQFEIKFYLTALLFIIFDIEIVLLLPWGLSGFFWLIGAICFIIFSVMLLLGFYCELVFGALEWD